MTKEEIRIVKTSECPSLSGRSNLTYETGCKGEKDVYLRLTGNTGSGIFNKDWISIDSLLSISENSITSGSLQGLFKGKSFNSAGFVLAVLLNEKLIERCKDNTRHYQRISQAEFKKAIQVLIDSATKKKTGKKQRKVS